MVKPFNFSRLPQVFFGPGKTKLLPGLIKRFGDRILFVVDGNALAGSNVFAELTAALSADGISFNVITVFGEPSPELIDGEVKRFSWKTMDAVVAAGGGSTLDTGKAISAMMYNEFPVREYLEGVGTREHPGTKIPFIAVPTTSGTGSEATKNAVISEVGEKGFKRSLRHDNMVPDIALVDPELTASCPPYITAASGMDCFTQLTEAFLSDKASVYTDALAWEGLKAVKSSLIVCYKDGGNIEARSGMSFAALTSGICLANAGLGSVHGFASSAGGLFNIPHGVLCGTLMGKANEINVRELRKKGENPAALKKYVSLGKLFIGEGTRSDDFYTDGFIEYLGNLTGMLNLPGLTRYGIGKDDLLKICKITDIKNNPVKLEMENLYEILYERL